MKRECGRRGSMFVTSALIAAVTFGCGGGGGSSSPGADPKTPAGTYTIMISGTTGSGASQSIALRMVNWESNWPGRAATTLLCWI